MNPESKRLKERLIRTKLNQRSRGQAQDWMDYDIFFLLKRLDEEREKFQELTEFMNKQEWEQKAHEIVSKYDQTTQYLALEAAIAHALSRAFNHGKHTHLN